MAKDIFSGHMGGDLVLGSIVISVPGSYFFRLYACKQRPEVGSQLSCQLDVMIVNL